MCVVVVVVAAFIHLCKSKVGDKVVNLVEKNNNEKLNALVFSQANNIRNELKWVGMNEMFFIAKISLRECSKLLSKHISI